MSGRYTHTHVHAYACMRVRGRQPARAPSPLPPGEVGLLCYTMRARIATPISQGLPRRRRAIHGAAVRVPGRSRTRYPALVGARAAALAAAALAAPPAGHLCAHEADARRCARGGSRGYVGRVVRLRRALVERGTPAAPSTAEHPTSTALMAGVRSSRRRGEPTAPSPSGFCATPGSSATPRGVPRAPATPRRAEHGELGPSAYAR